ncbi:MAG: lipid-A-disaccharide synthase [Chthoniobacteraceae bacterium]
MKLYLIAGEASGDARAAEVMKGLSALASEKGVAVEYLGAGGPKMQALAPGIEDWSGEAVLGIWDVIKKYPYFRRKLAQMLAEIDARKPDAVLFIDYPGFNLRMAKAIRKRNPAVKLFYYVSPQVWAWNRRRIPEMARNLDLMLCLFPFEKALYEQSGLKTVFVGHPLLDALAADKGREPREENLLGLFPGSRKKEVTRIFPIMLQTLEPLRRARPELRFEAAAASEPLAVMMREMAGDAEVQITVATAHSLMNRATVGVVTSGTATLEATYFELPFVLVYSVAAFTWIIGKWLVRVPFLGISNILAGREIVREFLQHDARPAAIADELLSFLNLPEKRAAQQAEFREVVRGLGSGGAAHRAADAIWAALGR